MRKEQGAEQRQFLQEQETIKDFVFTSQSTQTKVDPTAEEQSEEIKKEVRQHRVNTPSHHSPGSGPHNALWEMPTFTNARSVPQVHRLMENTVSIKQAM